MPSSGVPMGVLSLDEPIEADYLKSIPNFRDVGLTVNRSCGNARLREGKIYRSAKLDDASLEEKERMVATCGLTTIIDLRSKLERDKQAQKRDNKVQNSASASPLDAVAIGPVKIPGIWYEEINLNGGAFERALLWKLGWGSLTKFVGLIVTGYRHEAISLLGRDVVQPRGIIGLGTDTIDTCGSEFFSIFHILAKPTNYPILIHCTQGKDRTGLTVVLLLLFLRVPMETIIADYVASEEELHREKDSRIKELHEYGLSDDFADCPQNFVVEISNHVDLTYGGICGYFEHIGIDEEMRDALKRAILVENASLINA